MAIINAAEISKAIEGSEVVTREESLRMAALEAETLTQGLWPEVEKTDQEQPMSPSDIAEEAWKNTCIENEIGSSTNPRYVITRNEMLENDRHPISGVWFEKRTVELPNGEFIEGVFPKFESIFDARIHESLFLQPDRVQFRVCNRQLLWEIDHNLGLKEKFSEEQLEQIHDGIYDGTAPDGYVWHHDVEAGKLQLVDFDTHSHTGHTGGRSIWGGGSDNR